MYNIETGLVLGTLEICYTLKLEPIPQERILRTTYVHVCSHITYSYRDDKGESEKCRLGDGRERSE